MIPPEVHADVLIVTVTRVETLAVLAVFEAATGQKAVAVSIRQRVYRDLGMIHGARIFLALSEMGAGGLGASLQAVSKGIEALRPAAVVMVGIAFGADEQKQSLGDILVSQRLLLYEMQRVGADKLVPRGDRPHASPWLVDFLKSADLDWRGAKVRFGLVFTGEKLVDDIDYRKQLVGLEPEAIGGEMEGAGLYVACQEARVDWVLVKAICDWADGNKAQDKDARQQRAADNAASFVLHALQHAPLLTPQHAGDRPAGGSAAAHPAVTPASAPAKAPGPPPGSVLRPTRASLRKVLAQILRTTEDLNAFCIDYFYDVARRFGSGMSRLDREDLLFMLIEPERILQRLREHDPKLFARYESQLTPE